jgi:arylsulfatase
MAPYCDGVSRQRMESVARSCILGGFVWVAVLTGCEVQKSPAPPEQCPDCNVILITFDALRADRMGLYGYSKNTTPNLDLFAEEAFVFKDNMSQSGTTISSLPSLFTGKFPDTDSLLQSRRRLGMRPGQLTLADRMKASGRHTVAIVAHEYAKKKYGLGQGFEIFDDDYGDIERVKQTSQRVQRMLGKLKTPFFLWIHFRQPHAPYESTPEDFRNFYKPAAGEPTLTNHSHEKLLAKLRKTELATRYTFGAELKEMTPTLLQQWQAMYDGNLRQADRVFVRLIDDLKSRDLYKDSIIIVAADHAESLGEHGIFDHNNLYWNDLHTPLLVRIPGTIGHRIDQPTMNVDILPTILRLTGEPAAADIRGLDLFTPNQGRRPQIAEYPNRRTIKLGRFKLMEKPPGHSSPQLFDVEEDPAETRDLYAEQPEIAKELEAILANLDGREPSVEDPLRDRLRALGYLR